MRLQSNTQHSEFNSTQLLWTESPEVEEGTESPNP